MDGRSCTQADARFQPHSEEVEFELKTAQGQSTMWKRYLVQLGTVPVTYKCSAPRGGAVEADRVQIDSLEKVLRGSGEFGVFSRPFFIKGELGVCKDVPLPDDFDFQAALREAKSVGPSIHGVVLRGKGFGLRKGGVRLRECRWSGLHGGGRHEVNRRKMGGYQPASLLEQCGGQAFLAGWSCTVGTSFRAGKTRNAIVQSAEPPLHHRLQHDLWSALIWPAEPHKRPRAQVLVSSKPVKTTEESQKAARSWASVVRGDSGKASAIPLPVTRPVAAKRPLAGGSRWTRHDGFSSELEEGGVAIAEAPGKPKFQFTRHAPY